MDVTGPWLTPLVLLPGVALLLLSTSIRYGQIHQEFHHLLGGSAGHRNAEAQPLWNRAKLFRDALVGLYVSVCLLALGSMLGGVLAIWSSGSVWFVNGLTILGVLAVVYSSVQLIRESLLSLDVLARHRSELGIPE